MHEVLQRLLLLVWFLAYMAAIYLALHMVVARLSRSPNSLLLWFFTVLTSPLTWPVRALLPAQTPDRRVRLVALGCYVAIWLLMRMTLARLGGARSG
jgi:hypothetical protein